MHTQHTTSRKSFIHASDGKGIKKWFSLFGGLFVFVLMLFVDAPEGMSREAWHTAAVLVLMAVWWVAEVIPIAATALLPLVLFPVLGVSDINEAAAPYANPVIFLFMGGFFIAIAMQTWGLHRRIAINIIRLIGFRPGNIILGFMISSAFLSMWVSNTAATMMMLPIALSVIELARKNAPHDADQEGLRIFAVVLMLSLAYASNVGGAGTLIGTPANAMLAGFMSESYGVNISFVQWMTLGVPFVIISIPIIYFTLTRLVFRLRLRVLPGGRELIDTEIRQLGRITRPEIMVAFVFGGVALLWICRPLIERMLPGISDAGIAIFGAMLLFLLPASIRKREFLLNWKAAEDLPWGVLILFGGGLSLAGAIQRSGLAEWLGIQFMAAHAVPFFFVVVVVTLLVVFLTELTSNTATAAAFLPIMGAVAVGLEQNPLLLAVPVALAAGCAFMLPVATPPNAIVYGSNQLHIQHMVKAGFWLNIFFTVLITLLTWYLLPLVIL
jgi:solute carrier family 13 (sodium-dependent dicarboxylate transporter), member 2/3/5